MAPETCFEKFKIIFQKWNFSFFATIKFVEIDPCHQQKAWVLIHEYAIQRLSGTSCDRSKAANILKWYTLLKMFRFRLFERTYSTNTAQPPSGTFLVVLWCWILLNITLKCCNFPRFMSANVRRVVQSTVFQPSKMFAFWSVLVLNYFRFPRFFITLNISADTTFSIMCIIWGYSLLCCGQSLYLIISEWHTHVSVPMIVAFITTSISLPE